MLERLSHVQAKKVDIKKKSEESTKDSPAVKTKKEKTTSKKQAK